MGERIPEWVMRLRKPGECVWLTDPVVWGRGVALALAPHPDDPDAIAVTLRLLADKGWEMHWAVVTSGWSGVSDDFCGPDRRMKAEARMAEQRESARLFGLPPDRLIFLQAEETDEGELAKTSENRRALTSLLDSIGPDLVLVPHRMTPIRPTGWCTSGSTSGPIRAVGPSWRSATRIPRRHLSIRTSR